MDNENVVNYYCDESCHLQNDNKRYMVIGYISIPYNRIKIIKEDIKKLREKHNNSLEIKWTKLNSWNQRFYNDLVDLFFDRDYINFRAIIVDKNRYIADKSGHDYDRFYYLMYYQLIYHKLDFNYKYNIYLDIKDDLSNYRIKDLEKILNYSMGTILKIQHVRSHEVELIQLCDLFIGAISFKLNFPENNTTVKKALIGEIERLSGCSLDTQTPKFKRKFNLFKIKI